jgi:hypothetical protein
MQLRQAVVVQIRNCRREPKKFDNAVVWHLANEKNNQVHIGPFNYPYIGWAVCAVARVDTQ